MLMHVIVWGFVKGLGTLKKGKYSSNNAKV